METRQITNQANQEAAQAQLTQKGGEASNGLSASDFMDLFQNLLRNSSASAVANSVSSIDQLPDISIERFEQEEVVFEEVEVEMAESEEQDVELEAEDSEDEEVGEVDNEDQEERISQDQAIKDVQEEVVAELAAKTQVVEKAEDAKEQNSQQVAFNIEKQQVASSNETAAEVKELATESNVSKQFVHNETTVSAESQKSTKIQATESVKEVEYDGRKIGNTEAPSELVFTINKATETVTEASVKPYNSSTDTRRYGDPSQMIQNAVESALSKNSTGNAGAEARNHSDAATFNLVDATKKVSNKAVGKKAQAELPESMQDKIIDKIQKMLESAKTGRNGTSMVVRLDPPALGKVTMKLTHRGDQLFARIIPESSDVEATLRTRSAEIVNTLVSTGFKTENVNISFGSEPIAQTASGFEQMLDGHSSNSEQESEQKHYGSPERVAPEVTSVVMSDASKRDQSGWVA